jgi:hypothetical protein
MKHFMLSLVLVLVSSSAMAIGEWTYGGSAIGTSEARGMAWSTPTNKSGKYLFVDSHVCNVNVGITDTNPVKLVFAHNRQKQKNSFLKYKSAIVYIDDVEVYQYNAGRSYPDYGGAHLVEWPRSLIDKMKRGNNIMIKFDFGGKKIGVLGWSLKNASKSLREAERAHGTCSRW